MNQPWPVPGYRLPRPVEEAGDRLQHVREGCCWDNAVVESFFSTLKLERDLDDNREVLISPQQLQRDLAFWIEGYCNRERRHSTIGYISPIDYEQRCIVAPTLTPVNP